MPNIKQKKPRRSLNEVYQFTEHDLERNREGKLSYDQFMRLEKDVKIWRNSVITFTGVFIGLLIWVSFFNMYTISFFLCNFNLMFLLVPSIFSWTNFAKDSRKQQVWTYQGRPVITYRIARGRYRKLCIGEKDLKVSVRNSPYIDGEVYRVYCLLHSGDILSVERVIGDPFRNMPGKQKP